MCLSLAFARCERINNNMYRASAKRSNKKIVYFIQFSHLKCNIICVRSACAFEQFKLFNMNTSQRIQWTHTHTRLLVSQMRKWCACTKCSRMRKSLVECDFNVTFSHFAQRWLRQTMPYTHSKANPFSSAVTDTLLFKCARVFTTQNYISS